MKTDDLFYNLALQSIVGIGPIGAKKLLIHFGSAKKVFKAKTSEYEKIKDLSAIIRNQLKNSTILKKIENEMRFLENNNIRATCLEDSNYPSRLKHCRDAPIVLFSKGNIDFKKRNIISIVGTRRMTTYGRQFLKQFMRDIKKYDPIVISGLAYGIDCCAHQESLRNDISTIAVLAHGLDRVYPKTHIGIARKMLNNGGLISEFWSGTNPERTNFIKRNRIIAGLSEATLVIESASKGGSLITADMAFSYHRDVMAVPGKNTDKYSEGCNMLIKKNMAAMITSAADLESVLDWKPRTTQHRSLRKNRIVDLHNDEKHLYHSLLLSDKIQLDSLSLQVDFTIQKTASILLKLELKGMVRSFPGKLYQAI